MKIRPFIQTLPESDIIDLVNFELGFLKDVFNKQEPYRTSFPESANNPINLDAIKPSLSNLQQYLARLEQLRKMS